MLHASLMLRALLRRVQNSISYKEAYIDDISEINYLVFRSLQLYWKCP